MMFGGGMPVEATIPELPGFMDPQQKHDDAHAGGADVAADPPVMSFLSSPPPTPAPAPAPTASDGVLGVTDATDRSGQATQEQQGPRFQTRLQSPTKRSNPRYRTATVSSSVGQHGAKKSVSSRGRDSRLPSSKASSSVFDRLYKTQTVASKSMAQARSQVRQGGRNIVEHGSSPSKSPTSSRTTTTAEDPAHIFSRLHITGTVANTSKRMAYKSPSSSSSPYRSSHTPTKVGTPRSFGSGGGGTSPFSPRTPTRTRAGNLVYSPRMKPKTKLLFCSKHHPGLGVQDVPPISLGYSFFQSFCAYEVGHLQAKDVAREVIQAFFRQDFPQGRHWELQEPMVNNHEEESSSFDVKMSALYECEGDHKVATAQGIVRCLTGEVRVENYTYIVN